MPKTSENLRTRLQAAALELFREQGYERTTAAEIAARAGVTERTFFRYFADKREAFFEEDPRLRPALTAAVASAPATFTPLEVMRLTFASIEALLVENRSFTEPRRVIVSATPALWERAEAKSASLVQLLALALEERGVEERLAFLAARAGMAAFGYAAQCWYADPSPGLEICLDQAFRALHEWSTPRKK